MGRGLSQLQKKILSAAAQTDAISIKSLVVACFGTLSYSDTKYQSAYASVSRAVRKLKTRLLLSDASIVEMELNLKLDSGIFWTPTKHTVWSWVRLTPQGEESVKSVPPWDTFNRKKSVKRPQALPPFNLPPIKSVRLSSNATRSWGNFIRVHVHRPAFQNEHGVWDFKKLKIAVQAIAAANVA